MLSQRSNLTPLPGPELIDRIQQTLGIAVVVESIDSGGPPGSAEPGDGVTIQATLMFGSHTTNVSVIGDSEEEAWEYLAQAAVAWRNSDYQHIAMWPGGG